MGGVSPNRCASLNTRSRARPRSRGRGEAEARAGKAQTSNGHLGLRIRTDLCHKNAVARRAPSRVLARRMTLPRVQTSFDRYTGRRAGSALQGGKEGRMV